MPNEEVMRGWDKARRAIAEGSTSSWPRDWFESVIDHRDQRIADLEGHLANVIYAFDSLDRHMHGRRVVNLDERFAAVEAARKIITT